MKSSLSPPPTSIIHLINDAALSSGGAQQITNTIHLRTPEDFTSEILSPRLLQSKSSQKKINPIKAAIILLKRILFKKNTIFVIHNRLFLIPFIIFRNRKSVFICHCTYPDKNYIFKLIPHIKIIAVSDPTYNYLFKLNPRLNISTILNGIRKSPDEKRIKSQGEFFNIAFIGRLSREKGVLELVTAFSTAANAYPNLRLHLIGDGELRSELEAITTALNLKERVLFYGYQPNPFELIKDANLLIVPSHFEGFGLVYYEGLDRGHTILASKIAAFKGMPGDEHLFFFEPTNTDDLLEIIKDIFLRYNEIEALPLLAVRHNCPTIEVMTENYFKAFKALYES